MFDPLGYLAPVTVQTKLFLKKLWQCKINCDDPLENSFKDEWLTIAHEIEDATTVSMLRHYSATNSSDTSLQLHVVADASLKAYGTVAYLTAEDKVNFIIAKSWIAPVKTLTLPRLELMAAIFSSMVSKFIVNSYQYRSYHCTFGQTVRLSSTGFKVIRSFPPSFLTMSLRLRILPVMHGGDTAQLMTIQLTF